MAEFIFVTGLHRAGTHTIAEETGKEKGLLWLEESRIKWDSIDAANTLMNGYMPKWERGGTYTPVRDERLDPGFVLQCPGLAHKTLELAESGEVIWCVRDELTIVTSMVNGSFDLMAWHLMKDFHEQFPDDPIWTQLTYDGSEDFYAGFSRYYGVLIKMKKYFYETKFKNVTTLKTLEKQSYYDKEKAVSLKLPLKPHPLKQAVKGLE